MYQEYHLIVASRNDINDVRVFSLTSILEHFFYFLGCGILCCQFSGSTLAQRVSQGEALKKIKILSIIDCICFILDDGKICVLFFTKVTFLYCILGMQNS